MIHFTHFQTFPKIPKSLQRVKSSNLGTKSLSESTTQHSTPRKSSS